MKKKLLIALLAIISTLCCVLGLTACGGGNGDNATYYLLDGDNLDKEIYFVLDSGEWKDEDGASGTYKKNGDKIIFYIEFFGSTEEAESGTLKDGVLKFGEGDEAYVYISEKHKHKYSERLTTREATCTEDGEEIGICLCGAVERKNIKSTGHNIGKEWLFNEIEHYKSCINCNEFFETAQHNNSDCCTVCGYPFIFWLREDYYWEEYYEVTVKNTNITTAKIPATFNGKPVTTIGVNAFSRCSGLTSITIPDSVTTIYDQAFSGCGGLTSVTFQTA